jgi:hypothetical protein
MTKNNLNNLEHYYKIIVKGAETKLTKLISFSNFSLVKKLLIGELK